MTTNQHTNTGRQFVPQTEAEKAMYTFIRKVADPEASKFITRFLSHDARALLAELAALQPAAVPASAPGAGLRYVHKFAGQSDDSPTGKTWTILDTVTGFGIVVDNYLWYSTEDEAQRACDRLNAAAEQTGNEESGEGEA